MICKHFLIILSACMLCFPFAVFAQESGEDEPGAEPGKTGVSMNGAMGATVINGVSYQYFSLRPDIPVWKFGIGLDLSFYFDADGNLREDDWDEGADIIDKIYYVRYGKHGDRLFVRAGSLAPITLGYGLIMRRYTNAIEWPQVRRIGMQNEVNLGAYHLETVVNNFREIDSPGLVGARMTYDMKFKLPFTIGATIVHDGNQYLGAKDADGDGIPDRQDMFPGIHDGDHIGELTSLLTGTQITRLIGWGDLPDINNPPLSISERDEPVTEYGLDIGVPILRNKVMSLWAYAQAAQIADYGRGYAIPGLVWKMDPFRAGAEFRIFESKFLGDFFGYSYEVERLTWNPAANDYVTRESKLENIPSAKGFYADAGAYLFNIIDIYGAYQQMKYDNKDTPGKSLYASATLNTSFVPKIDLAEGYFQQPNAKKLFSRESDGTVIGYRIGTTMGGGVMLVYDNKTIYHNGKPNKIMTIETVIKFK